MDKGRDVCPFSKGGACVADEGVHPLVNGGEQSMSLNLIDPVSRSRGGLGSGLLRPSQCGRGVGVHRSHSRPRPRHCGGSWSTRPRNDVVQGKDGFSSPLDLAGPWESVLRVPSRHGKGNLSRGTVQVGDGWGDVWWSLAVVTLRRVSRGRFQRFLEARFFGFPVQDQDK